MDGLGRGDEGSHETNGFHARQQKGVDVVGRTWVGAKTVSSGEVWMSWRFLGGDLASMPWKIGHRHKKTGILGVLGCVFLGVKSRNRLFHPISSRQLQTRRVAKASQGGLLRGRRRPTPDRPKHITKPL